MFPDTRTMLPSEARAAITSFLLGKLEASPLDCYANPLYTYAQALGELEDDTDAYAWSVLYTCWHAAKELYNTRHPKKAATSVIAGTGANVYREGIPDNA